MTKVNQALVTVTIITLCLALSSCTKDETGPPLLTSVITATIDGVEFTSISTSISMQGDLTLVSGTNVDMSITFTIDGNTAGTYDLSLTSVSTGAYFPNASGDFFSSREGEIVVTELTENSIIATFAFEATNSTSQETVSVTNGSITITN